MHSISDEQIDFILDDITKKGVEIEDVKFNILDHVCCIIENEMPAGMDFYEFYRNTIARFYRKELKEIEHEAIELTTFKYFYAMKRTLKITGAITIALCLLGSLFKFQHWPGAGVMLLLSLGFFSLVFIPLNIIMKFKDEKEKTNKFIITFGFVLGMIITLGLVFKIFHWPGANIMMFGALGLFALVFTPIYFFTRYRNPETKFNAIVNTTFMVAGAGLLFGLVNLKNSKNYEESIDAMEQYQVDNAEKMVASNVKLYDELHTRGSEVDEIRNITNELIASLDGIQHKLISKSEGVSVEKAREISVSEVSKPNDFKVIRMHFAQGSDDHTYDGLINAVGTYNASIADLSEQDILRPIEIESLEMTNTTLSVVLNELVDIRVQALSNENSYLCLQKGLLASTN